MDEIELLKKKWLRKYWTSQNDIEVKEEKGSKIKVIPKLEISQFYIYAIAQQTVIIER